jgi:hypothetical protein
MIAALLHYLPKLVWGVVQALIKADKPNKTQETTLMCEIVRRGDAIHVVASGAAPNIQLVQSVQQVATDEGCRTVTECRVSCTRSGRCP